MFMRKHKKWLFIGMKTEAQCMKGFGDFYNPSSQDAEGLSEYVLEQLGVVFEGDFGKLIAQTYDGTVVKQS
jgi:hypothetical protein